MKRISLQAGEPTKYEDSDSFNSSRTSKSSFSKCLESDSFSSGISGEDQSNQIADIEFEHALIADNYKKKRNSKIDCRHKGTSGEDPTGEDGRHKVPGPSEKA